MKIFNWVHRRFNNKAENAKRNGGDEHFQAENKCDEVFERWGGGILTIGTFGYDPLADCDETVTNGCFFEGGDEDGNGDGDDHSSVKDDDDDGDDYDDVESDATYDFVAEEVMATETATEMEMEGNLELGFEYVMMEKRERTTLADLFVADSDKDNPRGIVKDRSFDKSDLARDKSCRKLIAKVDTRPIHKLNKLMRRMMRRKIHPEVGPTNTKVATVNNNFDYNYNHNYSKNDDYASLLLTQDTNI